MKIWASGVAALMLMLLLVSGAMAQDVMRLYVPKGTVEEAQAQRLLAMLNEEGPWTLMEDERTLRELVLAGDAPELAICFPGQARPWAREGLLLELQLHISGQQRMQRQALAPCVEGEALFMAPLVARHRQMAVNTQLMEEVGLGYMLDRQAYPVWYPAQFYQILEEFMIRDRPAMDVWRVQVEDSAAIEALTQAIFGGMLLGEDGETCRVGGLDMRGGVRWLFDAVDDGMIGYCESREEALARFLSGETAIYLDWTESLEKQLEGTEQALAIAAMPYPAAAGLPVRSFELVGVCAFGSGDAARDARLRQACARLHEGAKEVFPQRGIWQDGAVWLPMLEADDRGMTLRSLFCEALRGVMEEGEDVEAALSRVQAAMDALDGTQ